MEYSHEYEFHLPRIILPVPINLACSILFTLIMKSLVFVVPIKSFTPIAFPESDHRALSCGWRALVTPSRYPSSVEETVDDTAIFPFASEMRAELMVRFPVRVLEIAPVSAAPTRAFVK